MLALVLGLALSQAPKVVVVQTSNLGVSAKRTGELTQLLLELLKAEKLDAVEAKTACDNRVCVIATAKRLEGAVAVSVAFASLGKDAVMDLESILLSDGKPIGQTTFTSKAADTKLPFEALAFVADTRRGVPAPPPSKVAASDAPKDTRLTPPPAEAPPSAPVTAESSSAVPGVRIGLLAATAVAGIASLVLLFLAVNDNQQANATDPAGSMMAKLTRAQATARINDANQKYTVSAALGGATAALAIAAVVTFAF